MSRLCLVLLALLLAVVSTAVPANRTAKALGQLPDSGGAPWQEIAATDAPGLRAATGPLKRCQSGAGMLACPFFRPATAVDALPAAHGDIAYQSHAGSVLTGRSVPTPLRPPKPLSA